MRNKPCIWHVISLFTQCFSCSYLPYLDLLPLESECRSTSLALPKPDQAESQFCMVQYRTSTVHQDVKVFLELAGKTQAKQSMPVYACTKRPGYENMQRLLIFFSPSKTYQPVTSRSPSEFLYVLLRLLWLPSLKAVLVFMC